MAATTSATPQELHLLAAMLRTIADEHRDAAPVLSELADIYDYRAWRSEAQFPALI